MTVCSVFGCSNRSEKRVLADGISKLSFHKFPNRERSPVRHRAWINKINRVNFTPTKNSLICSIHFAEEDFETRSSLKVQFGLADGQVHQVLKEGTVPSRKLKGNSLSPPKKKQRRESAYLRNKTIQEAVQDSDNVQQLFSQDIVEINSTDADDEKNKHRPATVEIGIQCNLLVLPNNNCQCLSQDSDTEGVSELETDTDTVEEDDIYRCSSSDTGASDSDTDNNMSDDDCSSNDGGNNGEIKQEKKDQFKAFIVFWECLIELFKLCTRCGHVVTSVKQSTKGTLLIVTTICEKGHIVRWRSQKTKQRYGMGTVSIATAMYITGLSFATFQSFAETIHLCFMSERTFYTLIKRFVSPAIKHTWTKHKQETINELKKNKCAIKIAGDGQYDSPGFCAKYVTYTVMEVDTDKIIDFIVLQKGLVNGELEKPACDQLLSRLIDCELPIKLFLSDRHRGIRKLIRTQYPQITHEFDVWHVCKSLGKRIKTIESKAPGLESWKTSIMNHLWWSSMTCEENEQILIEKFTSILEHITNNHKWEGNHHFHQCAHDEIDGTTDNDKDKDYMEKNSYAYRQLTTIINDTNFINDLKHTKNYCHTGSLESYHNVRLKYLPKKSHFSYNGMVLRGMLAILDHNLNLNRDICRTGVRYSKSTKKYVVRNIRVSKDYTWRQDMTEKVCAFVRGEIDLSIDEDPYLVEVPKNIAPVPRPVAFEMHQSRFTAFQEI